MSDVKCADCDSDLDELIGLPLEERLPCPKCGSMNRQYSKSLEGCLYLHSRRRIRGRRGGVGKWFIEIVTGTDWSIRFRKFMRKLRLIDREKDLYEEKVIDPETGMAIHHTKERLSNHTDHGSAKGDKSS